jgi:hypothetical protein
LTVILSTLTVILSTLTVILSEAKDLQFPAEANQCRFFASLRMTFYGFWVPVSHLA